MPSVNDIAIWTVLLIWALGALCAVLLLLVGAQRAAWLLYREAVGWHTIHQAVRESRGRHRAEDPRV